MDLADLDRWDPNAIHTVFQAAIDRSNGVRGAATTIGDVLAATPWDGAAYDAAMQANGKIRADLIQHADACDAVGRAASTAEAQVRAIKTDWTKVQRMADTWGLTIHVDTGEISYMDPGTPEKRAEMERRADIVEAEIRSLITRANAADADLASAIRGAAGQETPAQIYDKLDDGAPPKESRPGEAEPEANRTYNQMKAFEKVFGHAPLSSADWTTAAALDPHSYNAKNGGVPPEIVVGRIEPVPGQGVVRTNFFIPSEDVVNPQPFMPPGFHEMNLGDNRGFSPTAGPESSRVAVVVDYENGIIVTRQNPSVNATNGEILTGHPDVTATQQSNGSVLLHYNTADPHAFGGEGVSKGVPISVNGTLGIQPGANGPTVGGEVTTFPAVEIYGQRPGLDQTTLLQSWPSFADEEMGPLGGLWAHKTVGDYGIVTGFNDMFPTPKPPAMPHMPGTDFVPVPAAPPMTFLPPSNMTPLGPVGAPPQIVVDNPTVILPSPPLR
jgi:hypothetical protein